MKETVWMQANAMKKVNELSIKGEIVVWGSTYMSGFPLYELVNRSMLEHAVYNRSIVGLTVSEALELAQDCVINMRPSRLFLALGEEDRENANVVEEYRELISLLRTRLPACQIFLIGLERDDAYTQSLNKALKLFSDGNRVQYIPLLVNQMSRTSLYRAQFKQLSRFFRGHSLTISEAFAMADV